MLLLIYKLDSDTNANPVCVLKEGEHIIGRGEVLKCNDQRASRNHAVIKIKDEKATITSTHQNPCFFQSANSTTVVILTKDVPTNLNDGDKFGIFPDQFWFKIKLEINKSDFDSSITVTSPKRAATEELNEVPCKIAKLENGHLNTTDNVCNETAVADVNTASEEKENLDISSKIAKEELSDSAGENETSSNNFNGNSVNVQNSENKGDGENVNNPNECLPATTDAVIEDAGDQNIEPSCSGTGETSENTADLEKKLRDRCWYGENCYRKSAQHKKEFSHPGDSDYDSDPNDQRPMCSYRSRCYRKNKDHLKHYKHPRPRSKPRPKCTCKKRNSRKKADKPTYKDNSSEEDDYDYNDPFLNDDSEDDYELSCSECDSDDDYDDDWTPSNNREEDSEEDTKTLMKEAKKFTKEDK